MPCTGIPKAEITSPTYIIIKIPDLTAGNLYVWHSLCNNLITVSLVVNNRVIVHPEPVARSAPDVSITPNVQATQIVNYI